jgi:hypothetical protein
MKTALVIVVLAAVSASAAPWKMPDVDLHGWKPAVALDLLPAGNQSDHNKNLAESVCAAPICSPSGDAGMTWGFRAGVSKPWNGLRVGPSFELLVGDGPAGGSYQLALQGIPPIAVSSINHSYRLTGEVGRDFPLNQWWTGSVAASLGMAIVREGRSCTDGGQFGGAACAAVPGSNTAGWVTWDITPTMVYQKVFEFGLRYMEFTRGGYLPWTTFGGTLGWRFR